MKTFELAADKKSELETALEQAYGVINRMALTNNGEDADCEELQDCFDAMDEVLKNIKTEITSKCPCCNCPDCSGTSLIG